jgi:hypothetical protein
MRCGGGHGVEDLAAGVPAHEVVPRSLPEQSSSSRAQRAATRVWDAATRICCGLESCESWLHPVGAMGGGPTVCQQRSGGSWRFTGRRFAVGLGEAGGVASPYRRLRERYAPLWDERPTPVCGY